MVKELDSTSFHSNDFEETDYDSSLECTNSVASQNECGIVLQQNGSKESAPTFGNISVTNGTDIHFGNKNFYQGPVTIRQFVYPISDEKKFKEISLSAKLKLDEPGFPSGIDNPVCDESVILHGEVQRSGTDANHIKRNNDVLDQFEGKVPGVNWKSFLEEYRIALITVIVFMLFFIFMAVTLVIVFQSNPVTNRFTHPSALGHDEEDNNTPIEAPIDPLTLKPSKLKLVSRLEWLAQPPLHPTDPLKTPVPYVIIAHTATENCSSQAQCVFQVRFIQTFHMESRGWWDIGYNFLVGGDGEVYIGRGWNKEGSHTFGYNKMSIGIAFIGTFINNKPPEYQLSACKKLIDLGVELGHIDKDYKLLAARQLQTTKSPGDALYEELKTWPHWSQDF